MSQAMKITELKNKYKNKWILAKVTKEDKKLHTVLEVEPLVINEDRQKVYTQLAKLGKGAHVATIYTGEALPRGLTFTFNVNIKV